MENMDQVFNIFNGHLEDPDTYIYLQSIKGLANCSFHKPDLVIDKLCHEFAHLDEEKYPGDKSIEVRGKIGEALVLVTRILGELTPGINLLFSVISQFLWLIIILMLSIIISNNLTI